MTLVLQGIALNDQPMSQPLIGRFDERGGTLGRSDTVTFTLPDPERTISRVQAQVLNSEDGYWIENVSAANPILHNGRPLSSGMRVLLREGDELRIGGYTLRAAFEQDETSKTILRGRTVITHQPSTEVMGTSRSALEAVLDLLDPAKLETTLGKPSVLESLQPARRKARLWELYQQHFRSIRQKAQEDLQRHKTINPTTESIRGLVETRRHGN